MAEAGRRPLILLTADLDAEAEPNHTLRDSYVEAVWEAGGMPVVGPNLPAAALSFPAGPPLEAGGRPAVDAAAAAVIEWVDGLVLTGGCDLDPYLFGQHPHPRLGRVSPRRDAWELALVRAALAAGRPILAICRGLQVLNVACGGTLIQDLEAQVPRPIQHRQKAPGSYPAHEVQVHDGTLLRSIAGQELIRVNSRHHQAVLEPGAGLAVSAAAPDGVVEAVEGSGAGFVMGVQWHPEDMARAGDPVSRRIFRAFVEAAGAAAVGEER